MYVCTLLSDGSALMAAINHVRRSRSAGGYLRLSLNALFLGRARGPSPLSAPPLRRDVCLFCVEQGQGEGCGAPFGIHWWAVLGTGRPWHPGRTCEIHRSRRPWYTVRRILGNPCTQVPDPAANAAPGGAAILPTSFWPRFLGGRPQSALAAAGSCLTFSPPP